MKRIILILFSLTLALTLCACGNEKEDITSNEQTGIEVTPSSEGDPSKNSETAAQMPSATETAGIPSQANSDEDADLPVNAGSPDGAVELGQNIFFYDLINLDGDAGNGLSPQDGADLIITDILAPLGFFDYLGTDTDECVYISFDNMDFLDSADGRECYIYSIAQGKISGGLTGDGYSVEYICCVDYEMGSASIYDDFGGTPLESDPGDTNVLNWWGEYIGEEFSIFINNFNGDSFSFAVSNLRNGEYIFEGVAAIDTEDDHLAIYSDCGFYLYEDIGAIDFLTSEGGEWAHLRGQYTQN